MKCLLPFLLSASLFAQGSLTVAGPPRAIIGSSVTLPIGLVNGGTPAGLQWDMSGLPAGATITSSIANKVINCNATRCLLSGMNLAAILDGQVASITYTQPATPVPFAISATLGASTAGTAIAITAPPPITVAVQPNCDVNGDGVVDATDVQLVLQQSLASTTGTPTIVDVIKEIIAAMGGACLR